MPGVSYDAPTEPQYDLTFSPSTVESYTSWLRTEAVTKLDYENVNDGICKRV